MPNSILREELSGAKSLEEVERILKDRPEIGAKRAYGRKISIDTVPHGGPNLSFTHGGPNLSFKLALKHHFWLFNADLNRKIVFKQTLKWYFWLFNASLIKFDWGLSKAVGMQNNQKGEKHLS